MSWPVVGIYRMGYRAGASIASSARVGSAESDLDDYRTCLIKGWALTGIANQPRVAEEPCAAEKAAVLRSIYDATKSDTTAEDAVYKVQTQAVEQAAVTLALYLMERDDFNERVSVTQPSSPPLHAPRTY